MKKNSAFTLLELLIATAISGFIIVSIMQGYRNAQKIHLKIRRTLDANHTACLFFNQIERDILTAFIPQEDTKKKDVKEEEKEQKIKGKKTDKKENGTLYFKASVYENQTKKIDDKKYELFKTLNFINTNPLQVWGQKLVRQVRIAYMLTLDKKNSTNNRNVYKLYRKETTDIKNVKFKEPEIINRKKPEHPVRKHLVAKNIKELYIEYIMPKSQNPKDDDKQDPEEKILKSFSWGDDKNNDKNIVPQYASIMVTFWDNTFTYYDTFQCMIPILSYPTEKEKPEKAKEKENEKSKKENKE